MILTKFPGLNICTYRYKEKHCKDELVHPLMSQVDTCVITSAEIPKLFYLEEIEHYDINGHHEKTAKIELINYELYFERIDDGRKVFEILNKEFLKEKNFKDDNPEYYI